EQVQRTPRGQTRSMRQQLANGDDLFVSAIEFGKVMRNGTVKRQFTEFNATRAEQRGDERLRERGEVVDRVELVGDAIRFDYRIAERIFVHDLIALTDEVNGRRKLARVDVLLQQPRKWFIPR